MKRIILRFIIIILIFSITGCGRPSRTVRLPSKGMVKKIAKLKLKKMIEANRSKEEKEKQQFGKDIKILKERNPFSPTAVISKTGPALNLTGIIWDKESPTAMINDQIVSEGDVIGNKKVKKITKDSVILIEDDKEEILRLRFD